MRTATLFLLAALLPLASACDTYYEDDRDDRDALVRVVDFELDTDGFELSSDTRTASFDTDDIQGTSDRDEVEDALRFAGDGALVLLYADNELILDVSTTGQTYTPLPVTVGYEVELDSGLPVVEYTITYTYAFDNEDLYVDVLSSARSDSFPGADQDPGVLFADLLPNEIEMRLVTLEADVYARKSAELGKTGIDLRNYEQVKAVFNLPD
ncbi:hypothetical protein [Rubricoccus marinus]|uniref:Uncharacterized protein n=1 Tax=Rubricoccus marinus TaxID=716817 RepID=A0A259TWE4_9BACT|nr:hypothetical protein [Rubricoccus marinus]OZC02016.1 hypothetical protein BSZ36_02885 [Rubricoccus marinus]